MSDHPKAILAFCIPVDLDPYLIDEIIPCELSIELVMHSYACTESKCALAIKEFVFESDCGEITALTADFPSQEQIDQFKAEVKKYLNLDVVPCWHLLCYYG